MFFLHFILFVILHKFQVVLKSSSVAYNSREYILRMLHNCYVIFCNITRNYLQQNEHHIFDITFENLTDTAVVLDDKTVGKRNKAKMCNYILLIPYG